MLDQQPLQMWQPACTLKRAPENSKPHPRSNVFSLRRILSARGRASEDIPEKPAARNRANVFGEGDGSQEYKT